MPTKAALTQRHKRSRLDRHFAAVRGIARKRLEHGPASMTEMAMLRARIERSLRACGYSRFVALETSFHMADWLDDLYTIYDLFIGRSRWTPKRVESILMSFLVHVPEHVAAAAKVLCESPVSDIFEVGSIAGSKPRRTAKGDPWRGPACRAIKRR